MQIAFKRWPLVATGLLAAVTLSAYGQADIRSTASVTLPDAPLKATYPDAPLPKQPQASPYMVNGLPYHQPTGAQRLHLYVKDVVGPERFAIEAVSAAYAYGRNDPQGWDNGAEGYGKHIGSAYGQAVISETVRHGLSAALHEDTHYIVCHGCTMKERVYNSVLSEFTARRGADGHRAWSLTPTISNYSGPLVSHNVWYPDGYNSGDAAIAGTTGYATHIGFRFARELYDIYKTKHSENKVP